MTLSVDQITLIEKIEDVLYDVDDHRWESFPHYTYRILKIFGYDISEQTIQDFVDERHRKELEERGL